jgi:putative transposase
MAEQRITYKYRLYPSRAQVAALTHQLSEACRLYNAALQERRDAWRFNRESVNYYTQAKQLKEIRANGDLGLINAQSGQDVLRRVDKTFKAFFARVKRKEKAGFPRFKSHTRFDSFTYPTYGDGCKLIDSKLRLQGIGRLKVKLHRAIEGKIKTVTIKRECGKWYVCFSVVRESSPLPKCSEQVGIDVGLLSFATLSDGTEVENPRYYREARAKLRRVQRKVARRKKGSKRRRLADGLLITMA